jgi:cytochrome c oxidase cbb3-type subunit 3
MEASHDGIREYDNPLPGWWKVIFVATIVFSIGYFTYYHGGGQGQSETEIYAQKIAALNEQRAKEMAAAGKVDEQTLAGLAETQPNRGRPAFFKLCVACHGEQGQGSIGPNLTDEHQIHGKTRVDIYKTIRDGVPAKGMRSWTAVLKPEEMMSMAAYVSTLRGRNIPGKVPEGDGVGPFPSSGPAGR